MRVLGGVGRGLLLATSALSVGCAGGVGEPEIYHVAEVRFRLPEGWSHLRPEELASRGGDPTAMVGSPDRRALAFVLDLAGFPFEPRADGRYGDGVTPELAGLTDAVEGGMARRYEGYQLLRRGATTLAGRQVTELVFLGRGPGEETRWRRLVLGIPGPGRAVMLGFGCPAGEQEAHVEDLRAIEASWEW